MSDQSRPINEDELDESELIGEDEVVAPIDPTNMDMIETARRKYGTGGAAIAAGMFGLDIMLGNKKKPDSVQAQEASSQPGDIHVDGIEVPVDDTTTGTTPALERRSPIGVGQRKSTRR